jgi:2-iminobutanoate/2-iminopropanoate deaminase
MRKSITSAKASAIGPYSHAVEDDEGLVFLSGQTPIDPASSKLIEGSIAQQTQQCFNNLFGILEAAGESDANA